MAELDAMTLTTAGEALLREVDGLLERERAVAGAAEALSQDAAVQAAYACGVATERGRILTLIQHQLDMLRRGGTESLCLKALQRCIRGEVVADCDGM